VLMMRKIAARLQRRVGPPFFQPLYDIVKLYAKRTQTSHGMVHDIGIVMAVGGYVAAETLLPMPGMNGIADKGGLITLMYLMMVPSLGMALGVGQCANPNGSIDDIAGICDPSGRIFGLMPHPEAFNHWTNHPDWSRRKELLNRAGKPLPRLGDGIAIFANAVRYFN